MKFIALLRKLGPNYWLTKGAGWLATIRISVIKNFLIRRFIEYYGVDMTSAVRQEPSQFENFQDFFTRELKPAARPISRAPNALISPVDGVVAAAGSYTNNTLVQYKNTSSNLFNLTRSSRIGSTGSYAIIYLSPKDYHRVHTPAQADLVAASRLGGSRFAVKPSNHQSVDGLYERNVRVNCYFRSAHGEWLLTMVGALIVSSVQTTFDEHLPSNGDTEINDFEPQPYTSGDELGRFCLGSTVILVIPHGIGELDTLDVGQSLKLGEKIGSIFNLQ
ncbi:MAG: phosphatidylserine decarboxylase [Gammaproteobacteria bacterium]|nr:phosphatidylserine decarboxylase [Gammaproteobacteria bacterium]